MRTSPQRAADATEPQQLSGSRGVWEEGSFTSSLLLLLAAEEAGDW